MEANKFTRAMKLFEIPIEFYDEAKLMINEEEVDLILAMGDDKYDEVSLCKLIIDNKINEMPKQLLKRSYSRAVLKKIDEQGDIFYKITNLYERYPYFAQYEYDLYALIPRERKEALNNWDKKIYMDIYGDDVRSKIKGENTYVHNSDFLTLEESNAFVDKHKDFIYMVPCNCKSMMFYHDHPLNVCMNFDGGINTNYDRGHGEVISTEVAKQKLKEFNKKGLMQNGEDYAICNCDGYCCYPLHMAKTIGSKGIYPKSHYNIGWNENDCINCGKCTRICNFNAFYFDENKKVKYDADKCWGCTICASNCPKGVIKLIKKE